ncbi:GerMN domain-containing protein [Calidithermus timidus]|jgi:spore germination protein GerM|uniref:GerMN domain-containing protein n=1 Tax=Calidithermus timidus TaxID=307124 RepID=UPI00035C66FC|nr:GerMN domain-containing protein [Calidithermus timidus]
MRRFLTFFNLLGLLVLVGGVWGLLYTQGALQVPVVSLPSKADEQLGQRIVRLHFANAKADGFAVETRTIRIAGGDDPLELALAELLKGPQAQGAFPIAPVGLAVPEVYLYGDVAVVNLPAEYGQLRQGSAAEAMLIYGMAYTLLDFPQVGSVRFLLGGKEVESLGHLSLLEPITRPR